MNTSVRIVIRNDYLKRDATSALMLQVIIDRKRKIYPLKISWPKSFFDLKAQACKPRYKNDPIVDDYNLIIHKCLAKCNEIMLMARIQNSELNHEGFRKMYLESGSKKSLCIWGENWAKQRYKDGDISWYTFRRYQGSIRKLIAWKKEILFSDLHERWGFELDKFLNNSICKRSSNNHNTRWHYHKHIKSIIKAAKADGLFLTDPYDFFKIQPATGGFTAINEAEFMGLIAFYENGESLFQRRVLRRFLFSCMTSLRLGDLRRVERNWLDDYNVLHFTPQKTIRHKKNVHRIPLNKFALRLFWDAFEDHGNGCIFDFYSDQVNNREIKKIAEKIGIKKNLSHHVGRHSFATMMLRKGARLNAVMNYMDHSKIEITMKYDHVVLEDLRKEVSLLDFQPDAGVKSS
jgi:integrase